MKLADATSLNFMAHMCLGGRSLCVYVVVLARATDMHIIQKHVLHTHLSRRDVMHAQYVT